MSGPPSAPVRAAPLTGRVAAITEAATRMGRAIARRLAADGA